MTFNTLQVSVGLSPSEPAKILLDGMELKGVTELKIEMGVDRLTTATIRMHVAVNGEVKAEVCPS